MSSDPVTRIEASERIGTKRNALVGTAALAGQAVAFLAFAPLLAQTSGAVVLGVWSLGSALISWASLFDFGVGESAAQSLAHRGGHLASPASVSEVWAWAHHRLARYALRGIGPATAAALLVAYMVPHDSVSWYIVSLYWFATMGSFLLGLPSLAYSAVHLGRGELWAQRLPVLVETLVSTGVGLAVLWHQLPPLVVLAVGAVLGRLSGVIARRHIFKAALGFRPQTRVAPTLPTAPPGTHFLLASVGARVLLATDALVLGLFGGAQTVGSYSFSFRAAYTALQVIWLTTDHSFALLGRLAGEGRFWKARNQLLKLGLRGLGLSTLAAVLFALLGSPASAALSPALAISPTLAALIASFIVVHCCVHVLGVGGQGLGQQKGVGRVILLGASANLIMSISLTPVLHANGVITGTVVSDLLVVFPLLVMVTFPNIRSRGRIFRWIK